jgi:diguanylate cyclase (GGDEF)-like protein
MPGFTLYAVPLLLAAVLCYSLSLLGWRLRQFKGIIPLCLVGLLCGTWALAAGLDTLTADFGLKIFYMQVRFAVVAILPVCWLSMVCNMVGKRHLLQGYRLALLMVIPLISLVIILTVDQNTLLRSNYVLDTGGPFPVILSENGPWFYVHMYYSYLLQAVSVAFLVHALRDTRNLIYRQALCMLVCVFVTASFNLLFNMNISPVKGFNFSPATFTLASLLMGWALFRYQLFDLAPIARSTVIETVQDGMLVFDLLDRLVDFNRSAQQSFNLDFSRSIGVPMHQLFQAYPDLLQKSQEATIERAEITLAGSGGPQYYELIVTPLKSNQDLPLGRLFLLHNITAQKQTARELSAANAELQSKLVEIELLQSKLREETIRDPLTGLFNRRYLDETLQREVAGVARTGGYLCIIMIDIDHFKNINDSFGHQVGDTVLQALSKLLQEQTRASDITCRYGGEEFVLVMPGIRIERAYQRAEQFRRAFEALQITAGETVFHSTFSAGLAVYPDHAVTGEELLQLADQALYQAKTSGRNCVRMYRNPLPFPFEPYETVEQLLG